MKAPHKYEEMKRRKVIENENYFKNGDTYNCVNDGFLVMSGFISGARKNIQSTIILEKKLTSNIKSVTMKEFDIVFRNNAGYMYMTEKTTNNHCTQNDNFQYTRCRIVSPNSINIEFQANENFVNSNNAAVTNNTVISLEIDKLVLEFSDVASDESIDGPEMFD